MRYITKTISVLNILLATIIALFWIYALLPLLTSKASYRTPPELRTKEEVVPAKVHPPPVPSPADYTVVAENNLFHPERRIPPEKKAEAQVPKPELVLYGTVIADDSSVAYVEDKKTPYSTPGRGARQRALKKGDTIGGFVLKDIQPNRITLVRNEEVMTVNLDTAKERSVQAGPPQPAFPAPPGQRQTPAGSALAPRPGAPQATPQAIPSRAERSEAAAERARLTRPQPAPTATGPRPGNATSPR